MTPTRLRLLRVTDSPTSLTLLLAAEYPCGSIVAHTLDVPRALARNLALDLDAITRVLFEASHPLRPCPSCRTTSRFPGETCENCELAAEADARFSDTAMQGTLNP